MIDKQYFEKQFKNYNETFGNGWGINWRAYMKLRAVNAISIIKEVLQKSDNCQFRLKEIGCATGDFTQWIIDVLDIDKLDIFVISDVSYEAIEICKKRFELKNKIKCVVDNILIDDDEDKYDIVTCVDVFEYFNEDEKSIACQKISNQIKDEGIAIIQIPLDKEEIADNTRVIEKMLSIKDIKYVYGQLWYDIFEKWAISFINIWGIERKDNNCMTLIAKILFLIAKSEKIVSFFFRINEKTLRSKSHVIYVVGKKNAQE